VRRDYPRREANEAARRAWVDMSADERESNRIARMVTNWPPSSPPRPTPEPS
jgi:hypothetical protein